VIQKICLRALLMGLLSASFTFTTGCKSVDKSVESTTNASSAGGSDLTKVEAQERKARLRDVSYDVSVTLTETDSKFNGTARLEFNLQTVDKPLRIDFFEGEVSKLSVNGQDLGLDAKKQFWIEIPGAALKPGRNQVQVTYVQEYSRQGQGLHQFRDPETQQTFLYTQFETFDANRFMPCFDQPDLRATLKLKVDAPAKWEVITTSMETSIQANGKDRRVWTFPETPAISTYLFSLHAGPYKVWKDKFQDIPLRLFARPSMAKYVRHQEWFAVTKQGLKFYNEFFALKYPFRKYDQLFVPEFNAGAMENVAAVTFSESYLERGEVTREQRRDAASVLLHEMAHMWFGNVVTMKWWNDLWLNESFATFMASLAMHEATEFKESWQDFFASSKNWAYWEDSLITTHPIEAPVPSVKVAFANFDGITYGKGAAVMKQLRVYMTPEAFKLGMQDYFKNHAYKNTELKDFIASLQGRTRLDLNLWADRWLRQSGTDQVMANWTCKGDVLEQVELVTTPSKGAAFRPQTVELALFQEKAGQLGAPLVLKVNLTKSSEVITGKWNCPSFVYPNYGDKGYISVRLDTRSLEFAKTKLGLIRQDLLLKTMVWDDLWEMVRSTEMPLKDYVTILDTQFNHETDEILLSQIVSTITGRRSEEGTVLFYWPKTEKGAAERMKFVERMEQQYLKRMHAAKPGSDNQKFWFDGFVRLARTPSSLELLTKWSKGATVAPGLPLDLDRQWMVARQLARFQRQEAATSAVAQLKRKDTSDRGQRQALAIEAVQPDYSIKQKWVNILKQPKPSVSYAEARSVLNALFPVEQRDLAKRFESDFYDYLKANGDSENEIFVEHIASQMAPLNCEVAESSKLRSFLTETGRFSPSVVKTLKVELEEDERCQRVRTASKL